MTETIPDKFGQLQGPTELASDTAKSDIETESASPNRENMELDEPKKTEMPDQDAARRVDSVPPDQTPGPPLSSNAHQGNQQTSLSPEQQLIKVKRELENMVIRYARSEADNLQNRAKSKDFESKLKRAIKDNESLANRIKILTNDKNQLSDTLSAKVAQLTVLEQKNCSLSNVQDAKLKELQMEVEDLRKTNEDLLKSIDTYKSKENELLDFSERLSMKQLLLQAELDKALANEPDYKKQSEQLVVENGNLVEEIGTLREQLRSNDEALINERKLTERLRMEEEELEKRLKRKTEEYENEMKVMKRKHQVATKELLKQIKCLQSYLDKIDDTHGGNKVTAS